MEAECEKSVERKEPKGLESLPCPSGGQASRCRIIELVDDAILAVRPPPEMKCTYKMRYGDAFLCTSPDRREAYKRHRI